MGHMLRKSALCKQLSHQCAQVILYTQHGLLDVVISGWQAFSPVLLLFRRRLGGLLGRSKVFTATLLVNSSRPLHILEQVNPDLFTSQRKCRRHICKRGESTATLRKELGSKGQQGDRGMSAGRYSHQGASRLVACPAGQLAGF